MSADSWKHDLAKAYRWAFHTRPCLTYTSPAGQRRDVIREAGNRGGTALPEAHGGFFLRVGDHVSRMGGALAPAERTAINGTHIEAAWSLARRAVRDTCCLVCHGPRHGGSDHRGRGRHFARHVEVGEPSLSSRTIPNGTLPAEAPIGVVRRT